MSTRVSNISKSPNKSDVWVVPEDKLKIIIRIRPVLNEEDQIEFVELENHKTLLIKRPGNFTQMKFSTILPFYSTQKDVFNLLEQSVNQFLHGTNITIFAYGQTGAGKTYSIIGNYSSSHNSSNSLSQNDRQNIYHLLSSEQRGILSRSLEMIMESLQNKTQTKVFISFYEIYNEKIYDLYNKEGSGALDIRQSKNGQISIPNLITIEISRIEEAVHYLMIGLKNRSTGSTHANSKSSRSHSIFQITLENQGRSSSLRIVDLAGSQKFKIPSDLTAVQKQIRIQQLTSINGSLSCLGHCISALIQKSRTHIPFRNSKLTRILSDSLLGHGKMRFIICISPSVSASAQTFSTLQFANRAKRAIFDRSEMRTPQLSKKKSQNQEMLNLRKQLQREKQLRLAFEEELKEGKKENAFLKIQNEKLKHRISQISSKTVEMNKSIVNQKNSSKNLKTEFNRNQNQNFESQTKQNESHEEMLNLPIFQKNRSLIHNPTLSSCSMSLNRPINVKKAEFEKKIKKFIEQSSPQNKQSEKISNQLKPTLNLIQQTNQNHVKANQQGTSAMNSQTESIQRLRQIIKNENKKKKQGKERGLKILNNYQIEQPTQIDQKMKDVLQNEQEMDSLWQYHEEQTQEFFEKACEKMNMREYEDLKSEMQKAKNELLRFKQLDDQLQKKKISAVR